MTEELNNFCTDLKDLFMKQDFLAMEQALSERSSEEVAELAMNQRDILVKYYEQEKYEMLLSHLNFVAFASYLFEYAGKRGIFTSVEYEQGFEIFLNIYQLLQDLKNRNSQNMED